MKTQETQIPAVQHIRKARESAGLTVEKLAEKCGLHPKTINQIEQGRRKNPGIETVRAIFLALGADMGDFNH